MKNYLKKVFINFVITFIVISLLSLLLKNTGIFVNWIFVILVSIINALIVSIEVFFNNKNK